MTLHGVNFQRMFEFQTAQTPDKPAVVCNNRALTFSELNARANQLARYLVVAGVGPEVLVGIYMQRSLEMVIGILGVLKAGGAYLPVDPAHHQEGVAAMFKHPGMPLVLTQENLFSDLAKHTPRLMGLDAEWAAIGQHSEANLPHTVSPKHLAYIICTSGSTASPKWVMLTRANVSNYVVALKEMLSVGSDDIFLCSASIAVSSFRRQCILPLSQGATVVIATEEQRRDPIALCSLAKELDVTVLDSVPSFFRNLTTILSGLEPATRRTLLDNRVRLILTAGEPLPAEAPSTWMYEFRHAARHVHIYGQTETGSVSLYQIPADMNPSFQVVPIGRPLPNVEIHLLGANGQPVPAGEPGEIHVAGPGLARGYFNNPELTQQKFIAHPSKRGARLFKTGDWVRRLSDGNLVHLGRQDHQIKVRGFRVDTSEIEAVLAQNPGVKESVVVARKDVSGDQRLVAYVVLAKTDPTGLDEVRHFLYTRLPYYMLPSQYVALDRLPTSASGKVDRRALPAPGLPASRAVWRRPRDEREEVLAILFAELLGVERVGIDDDFFELGGQSLVAMQLVARVRALLNKDLPMAALLEAPTVAGIAGVLQSQEARPHTCIVPIQPHGTKPPFFCVHGLDGPVISLRHLGHCLGLDQPLYGIQAIGLDGRQTPHSRVPDMASHYIREMRNVQPVGPYFVGGWSFGGMVAFEIAQQLLAGGDSVSLVSLFDTRVTAHLPARKFPRNRARLVRIYSRFHAGQASRLSFGEKCVYVGSLLRRHADMFVLRLKYGMRLQPLGGIPFNNVAEAHRVAARRYHPKLYPGKLTLFRSAYSKEKYAEDPFLGWEAVAGQGVEILDVPGDHSMMLQPPHVAVLAQRLAACLERARTEGTTRNHYGDGGQLNADVPKLASLS